jgi:alpha-methylacyl-CoA racemase
VFRTRTRAEWVELPAHAEACASPVLALDEAPAHPHNAARQSLVGIDGVLQPAPAPRFSRTPGGVRRPPPRPGTDMRSALTACGISEDEIDALLRDGAVVEVDCATRTGR